MILRLAISTSRNGARLSSSCNAKSATTSTALRRCFSSKSEDTWNWMQSSSSSSSTSTKTRPNSQNDRDARNSEILRRCGELYASLMPINEKVYGPLENQVERPRVEKNENVTNDNNVYDTIIGNNTLYPFVFLVGNHSSGKSSFINYVLGRDVQTSGVAPTDDCFTVITSGGKDIDQDGPALIFGNPELGFAPLRQFGPNLVHHTQLKVRTDIQAKNFMMVDSPGMIDSPASTYGSMSDNVMDRGYDFPGVVRWFAERADIVLLFFDPDKPGTTGESLSILLHSLAGMDHKLLIVLNKADQFKLIHDFARAYGSLCWNLSKVIPRKDLPRIYTMCLPVDDKDEEGEHLSKTTIAATGGLADLHSTRDDVVAEVMKAPQRRIDNIITHLYDSVSLLEMHVKISQDLRQRYQKVYWDCKYQEIGLFSSFLGLTIGSTYLPVYIKTMVMGGLLGTCILGTGGVTWYNNVRLRDLERDYLSDEGLSNTFQRCYRREINEGDEFIASLWQRVRDPLRTALREHQSVKAIASVSDSEIQTMKQIMEEDIPALRRKVSPTTT